MDQGQRRIPIQYAKRVVGRRMRAAQHLPAAEGEPGGRHPDHLRDPSVLYFPTLLASVIHGAWFQNLVNNQVTTPGARSTWAVLALLIVFFSYFYTAIQFDPVRTADQIAQAGWFRARHPSRAAHGHLPQRHPGAHHAARLALPRPRSRLSRPSSWRTGPCSRFPFGGTSVLIAVGVALETMKQIESQLLMRHYEGFILQTGEAVCRDAPGAARPSWGGEGNPVASLTERYDDPADLHRRHPAPAGGGRDHAGCAGARRSWTAGSYVPDVLVVEMVSERLAESDAEPGVHPGRLPTHPAAGARAGPGPHRRPTGRSTPCWRSRSPTTWPCADCRIGGSARCARRRTTWSSRCPRERFLECDNESAALVRRADDDELTVRRRLAVYQEQTAPLERFYRSAGC